MVLFNYKDPPPKALITGGTASPRGLNGGTLTPQQVQQIQAQIQQIEDHIETLEDMINDDNNRMDQVSPAQQAGLRQIILLQEQDIRNYKQQLAQLRQTLAIHGHGIIDDIKDTAKSVLKKGTQMAKKAGKHAKCEAYVASTLTPDKMAELGLKSTFTPKTHAQVLKEHRQYHKKRCMDGIEGFGVSGEGFFGNLKKSTKRGVANINAENYAVKTGLQKSPLLFLKANNQGVGKTLRAHRNDAKFRFMNSYYD